MDGRNHDKPSPDGPSLNVLGDSGFLRAGSKYSSSIYPSTYLSTWMIGDLVSRLSNGPYGAY